MSCTWHRMSTICKELVTGDLFNWKPIKYEEKGSKSWENQNVKFCSCLEENCPQKLVIAPIRSELKPLLLNGSWGNSSFIVSKTHTPWLQRIVWNECNWYLRLYGEVIF